MGYKGYFLLRNCCQTQELVLPLLPSNLAKGTGFGGCKKSTDLRKKSSKALYIRQQPPALFPELRLSSMARGDEAALLKELDILNEHDEHDVEISALAVRLQKLLHHYRS